MANHVLRYVPFLGQYMTMTGMLFVNRSRHMGAVKSMALAAFNT